MELVATFDEVGFDVDGELREAALALDLAKSGLRFERPGGEKVERDANSAQRTEASISRTSAITISSSERGLVLWRRGCHAQT